MGLAGGDLLQAKLTELVASEPRILLPDRLLHRVLARLAVNPEAFPGQHAALRAFDPRLQPGELGRPVSAFFLPLLETAHRGQPTGAAREPLAARQARVLLSAEQLAAMADMAKPRNLAGLLEELGYGATASGATVRELLQQVRLQWACGCAVMLSSVPALLATWTCMLSTKNAEGLHT